jgi:hypothetical protein
LPLRWRRVTPRGNRRPRVSGVARSVDTNGAVEAPDQGAAMADKSPRQHLSKKAGKSIKEKRAEKSAKANAKNKTEIVPPGKRR